MVFTVLLPFLGPFITVPLPKGTVIKQLLRPFLLLNEQYLNGSIPLDYRSFVERSDIELKGTER